MRDMAQMTWALGMLEQPELPFLAACQQGVTRRMGKVLAVDATNLLWGYARLEAPPAPPAMYTHIVRTPFPHHLWQVLVDSSPLILMHFSYFWLRFALVLSRRCTPY